MAAVTVKEEQQSENARVSKDLTKPVTVIDLSSSETDSSDDDNGESLGSKRRRLNGVLPVGFLDPLPPEKVVHTPEPITVMKATPPSAVSVVRSGDPSKQFWKAGDYEGELQAKDSGSVSAGLDHVRVHPKFLHSNATSHKWALGAFAELMDNALDEVCNGATYVNVDMLDNKKDGTKMLLVEDNGGGMDPDKMRQCMSLGYSAKSKSANTIGQYGNGFKTSTMRLGADVIVFSRCCGKDGKRHSQSIGMLSYTFLRNTRKEDIVVPMLDYKKEGSNWKQMKRVSSVDWDKNLETILTWSPYISEADLLDQFHSIGNRGTRIVIYNLWENEHGQLELDFVTDKKDIQLRGVNRDEKKIQMASQFPNSRHFLTYQHSLRSYASILYLRLPGNFKMILRGKEIDHHDIGDDMILKEEITYRPQHSDAKRVLKDRDLVAVVTIGFVKDAKDHIDVQGFNVYHKNRLIKPFWRVWNAAGSDGRGVIGVLEANFVEPAHDKQGFERTSVLARLEAKLVQMQKQYWSINCHRIGYAPRRKKHINGSKDEDSSSQEFVDHSTRYSGKNVSPSSLPSRSADKFSSFAKYGSTGKINHLASSSINKHDAKYSSGHSLYQEIGSGTSAYKFRTYKRSYTSSDNDSDECLPVRNQQVVGFKSSPPVQNQNASILPLQNQNASILPLQNQNVDVTARGDGIMNGDILSIEQLKEENSLLQERLKEMEETMSQDLQKEKDRSRSLSEKLEEAEKQLEELNKEQEALIDIFSEERSRRDREEDALRKKLKDASVTIHELMQKLSGKKNAMSESKDV